LNGRLRVSLRFPGSIDGPWPRFVVNPDARGIGTVRYPRIEPRDEECAKKLANRTLTNLYNERPAWLAHAHAKLDAAVAAAYGFNVDLTDEQILEKLLALNIESAQFFQDRKSTRLNSSHSQISYAVFCLKKKKKKRKKDIVYTYDVNTLNISTRET